MRSTEHYYIKLQCQICDRPLKSNIWTSSYWFILLYCLSFTDWQCFWGHESVGWNYPTLLFNDYEQLSWLTHDTVISLSCVKQHLLNLNSSDSEWGALQLLSKWGT